MAGEIQPTRSEHSAYMTPRDCASVIFQHRRLVFWTFSLIFGAAVLYALFRDPSYRSEMTIMIHRERTDPVVTTDASMVQRTLPSITDKEINSELQLLRSEDLLRQVVLACNLHVPKSHSALASVIKRLGALIGKQGNSQEVALASAARRLRSDLAIALVPNSALIRVSYVSLDPELPAKVLSSLAELYVKKHLAVSRPKGIFDFFNQEAKRYHRQLLDAERTLDAFTRDNHLASVDAERDATLKKLTELEVAERETEASIDVTADQIRALHTQMAHISARLTTQLRKSAGRPPDQLQSTLLALQLKRAELLGLFQPDYPAIKDVETQIAAAQAAIAVAQETAVVEETTDRDPTYEWLRAELEKVKVGLANLQSRSKATRSMIAQLKNKASWLNGLHVQQSDLVRSVKLAEGAYLVYQNKQEEAQISDALDRQRILNVAIADKPLVPVLPSNIPGSFVLLIGLFAATGVSSALAFGAERINSSFRTPREVERFIEIPVIAAIPERVE